MKAVGAILIASALGALMLPDPAPSGQSRAGANLVNEQSDDAQAMPLISEIAARFRKFCEVDPTTADSQNAAILASENVVEANSVGGLTEYYADEWYHVIVSGSGPYSHCSVRSATRTKASRDEANRQVAALLSLPAGEDTTTPLGSAEWEIDTPDRTKIFGISFKQ